MVQMLNSKYFRVSGLILAAALMVMPASGRSAGEDPDTDSSVPEAVAVVRDTALEPLGLSQAVPGTPEAVQQAKQYYDDAVKMLTAGNYDSAIELFGRALEIGPNLSVIHNFIGIANLQTDPPRPEDAADAFKRAIDADPSFAEPYFNLGSVYLQYFNDIESAKEQIQRSIELDPAAAPAYNTMGWIHIKGNGDVRQGLAYFEKAVSLQSDFAMAQYGMGLSYVQAGKASMALRPISELRRMGRPELAKDIEDFISVVRGGVSEDVSAPSEEKLQGLEFSPVSEQAPS